MLKFGNGKKVKTDISILKCAAKHEQERSKKADLLQGELGRISSELEEQEAWLSTIKPFSFVELHDKTKLSNLPMPENLPDKFLNSTLQQAKIEVERKYLQIIKDSKKAFAIVSKFKEEPSQAVKEIKKSAISIEMKETALSDINSWSEKIIEESTKKAVEIISKHENEPLSAIEELEEIGVDKEVIFSAFRMKFPKVMAQLKREKKFSWRLKQFWKRDWEKTKENCEEISGLINRNKLETLTVAAVTAVISCLIVSLADNYLNQANSNAAKTQISISQAYNPQIKSPSLNKYFTERTNPETTSLSIGSNISYSFEYIVDQTKIRIEDANNNLVLDEKDIIRFQSGNPKELAHIYWLEKAHGNLTAQELADDFLIRNEFEQRTK